MCLVSNAKPDLALETSIYVQNVYVGSGRDGRAKHKQRAAGDRMGTAFPSLSFHSILIKTGPFLQCNVFARF